VLDRSIWCLSFLIPERKGRLLLGLEEKKIIA
jgi:hypothetical protein